MASPAFSSDAQAASGADQRARILVAAEAVIRERGLNQTRLRDVAAAAGVSTGMVQHYFDSRDRLLAEAFQYNNRRRAEAWGHAAVSSADAWGKIESLITHALDPRRLAERSAVYVDFCFVRYAIPSCAADGRELQRVARTHTTGDPAGHRRRIVHHDRLGRRPCGLARDDPRRAEIAAMLQISNMEPARLRWRPIIGTAATLLGYRYRRNRRRPTTSCRFATVFHRGRKKPFPESLRRERLGCPTPTSTGVTERKAM